MTRVDEHFKQRVYEIVAAIPRGKVMTYGQVAAAAGAAWASWEVGQIAHLAPCVGLPACSARADQPAGLTAHQASFGSAAPLPYSNTAPSAAHRKKSAAPSAKHEFCPAHDLPWQRIVNKNGGLARGYPGGFEGHKKALLGDGLAVDEDYRVNIEDLLWRPPHKDQSLLL